MSIDFKVKLRGIGGCIPGKDKTSFLMAMVDATKRAHCPQAPLDGDSSASRHRPVVIFPGDLWDWGSQPQHVEVGPGNWLWYLEDCHVRFEVTRAAGLALKVGEQMGAVMAKDGSLAIAHAHPDVYARQPDGAVVTQVFFDEGEVEFDQDTPCIKRWSNFFFANGPVDRIIEPAVVDFGSVTGVKMIAEPFDRVQCGKAVETVIPIDRGDVRIDVGNLCADSLLKWQDEGDTLEDIDFKWLYRLCADREKIEEMVAGTGGLPYPVAKVPPPHPDEPRDPDRGGEPCQCYRSLMNPEDLSAHRSRGRKTEVQ